MLNVMLLYGPWDNYIASQRKHAGLFQDELAVLVGLEGPGAVREREHGYHLQELEVLIALEVVFDAPIQQIVAGVAKKARGDVASRARSLLEGMTDKPNAQNARKLDTLARLAHVDEEDTIPCKDTA